MNILSLDSKRLVEESSRTLSEFFAATECCDEIFECDSYGNYRNFIQLCIQCAGKLELLNKNKVVYSSDVAKGIFLACMLERDIDLSKMNLEKLCLQ